MLSQELQFTQCIVCESSSASKCFNTVAIICKCVGVKKPYWVLSSANPNSYGSNSLANEGSHEPSNPLVDLSRLPTGHHFGSIESHSDNTCLQASTICQVPDCFGIEEIKGPYMSGSLSLPADRLHQAGGRCSWS